MCVWTGCLGSEGLNLETRDALEGKGQEEVPSQRGAYVQLTGDFE